MAVGGVFRLESTTNSADDRATLVGTLHTYSMHPRYNRAS